MRSGLAPVFVLVVLAFSALPAGAHSLKLFASPVGDTIEGRVYFVGGNAAGGVAVVLETSGGDVADRTTTAADGSFALPVETPDDYTLRADAGDGHVAEFRIPAARLEGSPAQPAQMIAAAEAPLDLDAAIVRQVAPLAAQIDALDSALRLRDIVGGVGYILGIFGLWALLKSRERGGPS